MLAGENVKEIFAPVFEKEEELAPAKPEVFYDEEHDAADDNVVAFHVEGRRFDPRSVNFSQLFSGGYLFLVG